MNCVPVAEEPLRLLDDLPCRDTERGGDGGGDDAKRKELEGK